IARPIKFLGWSSSAYSAISPPPRHPALVGVKKLTPASASKSSRERLRSIAIVPGDDRMHLRLGQTARHDAQNKTSRHNQGHHRFHAQSDRLQPDPHSQIADGLADSAHNHPVAPRVRRQKDKKSATLHVLQRTARSTVGDYLKMMDVPAVYIDLMFS